MTTAIAMTGEDVEARIAAFVARYTPEIATQLQGARARLRAAFPRGYELVFDNYNALVLGISPTERSADAFVSVAGYPQWVRLFFLRGVDLPDPDGLLDGDGKQVRSVRLKGVDDFDDPAVGALIAHATNPHRTALAAAPPLETLIKTVVEKQRSRRPVAK